MSRSDRSGEDTDADDRELVEAVLERGDEAAFRHLFRRHSPVLYALALRLLGPASRHADDAVQETWLRAAGGLGAFAWRSSLRTWLIGITIRCVREIQRRERSTAWLGEAPEPAAPASSRDLDLERAVRSLPNGYREVVILHDVLGLTHQEIALRLDIEAGTSKSQLARGRRALRERLGLRQLPGPGGDHER
ncbi:MAG TPA: RNA polymerase sigma factor [Thermoanaerobaculia bacterium]|nr:RNA polymerase sigma factor [Thermoanaerobaculia bacterium]